MANPTADKARRLTGRRVTVTTDQPAEPYPITGRLGHVHEDVYLDVLDTDDGRRVVRIMFSILSSIEAATDPPEEA